ncbi:MAG TPA: DUF2330 domain-containing protein [Polyangiaceae bacterium]
MRARFFLGSSILAALAAATALLPARPARACGGCFHPPPPPMQVATVITGHRMAFSISPQQSVLWDQIEYSGSPSDFAWVLPVHQGAQLQLSHDEFFAALDALTTPVITGPTPECGSSSNGPGFGCSSSSNASGASPADFGGSGGGSGVQVINQGVVGPYDTVTLRSTNPNALYDWLVANKYDVPASTRPIIDAYVAEKFDFIALRLAPGEGVQAMQPVRVVTPGASLSLPLRMVAAGAGANVGITLWVISDGRYEMQNFPNGTVDASKLVWEHAQNLSNYSALAAQVMQGSGGRTWLTEFAQGTSLAGSPDQYASGGNYSCGSVGGGAGGINYYGGGQSLAEVYFAQCLCAGGGGTVCPLGVFSGDAANDGASEGGESEAGEGGAVEDAGSAQDAAGSDGDAGCNASACDGYDDLDVASVGLDPNSTWITRMRAVLPASALASDLVVEAAPSQTPVSKQLTASVYDDPTYDPCASGAASGSNGGCAMSDASPWLGGRGLVVGGLAFLAVSLVRRRRLSAGGRRRRD